LFFLYIHVVLLAIVPFLQFGYDKSMFFSENFIVFPEGDIQEVQGRLPFNALVDINGNLLVPPLPTKMIVFKITAIKTDEKKGVSETFHFLELLSAEELLEYTE